MMKHHAVRCIAAGLVVGGLSACGGGGKQTSDSSTPVPGPASTTSVTSEQVTYVVGGYDASNQTPQAALNSIRNPIAATYEEVDVTYRDLADSTIQQATVSTPWSQQSTGSGLAQVSVQESPGETNRSELGVFCAIEMGGSLVDIHGTTGENVAECQAKV